MLTNTLKTAFNLSVIFFTPTPNFISILKSNNAAIKAVISCLIFFEDSSLSVLQQGGEMFKYNSTGVHVRWSKKKKKKRNYHGNSAPAPDDGTGIILNLASKPIGLQLNLWLQWPWRWGPFMRTTLNPTLGLPIKWTPSFRPFYIGSVSGLCPLFMELWSSNPGLLAQLLQSSSAQLL